MRSNADQIRAKSGPFYRHWAMRTIMAGHRHLIGERPQEGVESDA